MRCTLIGSYRLKYFIEILISPESQRIAINSDPAMFYCKTRGSSALWNVNGIHYSPYNHTKDGIEFSRVITYHEFDSTNNVHDIYMKLPSEIEWNMTEIHCASRTDRRVESDNVYLIIMGKLLMIADIFLKFIVVCNNLYVLA